MIMEIEEPLYSAQVVYLTRFSRWLGYVPMHGWGLVHPEWLGSGAPRMVGVWCTPDGWGLVHP